MTKKILGLDLGTNSIGWALIDQDFEKKEGKIYGLGSRIIPMSQEVLGKFDSGVSISQTAERTKYRGTRRLNQRNLLRRERLHRVLNILNFLPLHYANAIDFEKHLGQFKTNAEVKLNYTKTPNNKYDFIFMASFYEMVNEFEDNGQNGKVPYDWTLYYLRKKALTQKISKEELAWVILNFNQKRGYYQLRSDEDESEDKTKLKEFKVLKVKDVIDSGDMVEGKTLYNIIFENGWRYDKQIVNIDEWRNKTKEFIITTTLDENGLPKKDNENHIKRSFKKVDSESDWIAIKKKTEQDIHQSQKTVGQYIYEALLLNPKQKIRGKLVKTIERKFYIEEFEAIIKEQIKHHSELQSAQMYQACIEELYPRNEAHKNSIKGKGFDYLFAEDIIFYQRPLKSKKSTISGCTYETRIYKKEIEVEENGNKVRRKISVSEPVKSISKSHPLFQEFRLWQFLKNLKIYKKDGNDSGEIDVNITSKLFQTEDSWTDLFDFLITKKEVEQKHIIQYFISKKIILKINKGNYRWNYAEDKKHPCYDTRVQLISRLKKVNKLNSPIEFLETITHTSENDSSPKLSREMQLWHIIYSVKDKDEFEGALGKFALKHGIDEKSFVENFKKFPPFKSEYAAYSQKAIKRLLPLMRLGKYWNESQVPQEVKNRVSAIIERLEVIKYDKTKIDDNVIDDDIPGNLLKSFIDFKDKNPLKGLNTYQACYAVYDRHSEASDVRQWKAPKDIDSFLTEFKQHSLRNPIVEQVVTETLRTVRDIWLHYGKGEKNFINEIHIELGREMKNSSKKREAISSQMTSNENTNHRIKKILEELKNDVSIEGEIRPYSPSHQEILKIYEQGVLHSTDKVTDDIVKIRKSTLPTKSEINRYKLWLEQGYISPYTGRVIPLTKLFTTAYQIEHIIPQSRYFDDSLSNKVICESAVNAEKSNMTAYEFIESRGGDLISSGQGNTIPIFKLEDFEAHCNKYFKKNRSKLKKLLSKDIPEGFIDRQLNDSRYISKLIKGLLSNIVREENEQEAISKHTVAVTGAITSKLKQDWGLNDKWNELIAPRFKRLNEITNSEDFGYWDKKINAFRTQVPDTLSKGFNKKRIDHRHHALDALVIACTSKKHINYLNSLNSEKENYKLRDSLLNKNHNGHYSKHFLLPWDGLTSQTKEMLKKTIISFKQNLRVINKTNNKTWQWVRENGQQKKELVKQSKGDNWAIRKALHKETIYGKVTIKRKRSSMVLLNTALENWELIVDKRIKSIVKSKYKFYRADLKLLKKYFKDNPIKVDGETINKLEIYEFVKATASRIALSDKFTRKQLESVTDSGIQSILENHIKNYIDDKNKERFDLAFSSDGCDDLNKNITSLNNGKQHQPIYKIRIYEVGKKFKVGDEGSKKHKFVEAAKGTNLFFNIYWDQEKQQRVYDTIPLNEVIEHQKQTAHLIEKDRTLVPANKEKGQLLFSLSPNDLVYVPTDEEVDNQNSINFGNLNSEQVNRIYKMVSCTGSECHFIPNSTAREIQKNENGTNSKNERVQLLAETKLVDKNQKAVMIKERSIKLKVDRLGNVEQAKS